MNGLLVIMMLTLVSCSIGKKWVMTFEKNPYPNDPQSVKRGAEIYKRECSGCHGVKGLGDGELGKDLTLKVTNLVEYAKINPVNNIALHVKHGKFDTMPDFVKNLSHNDVWDVANYVKGLSK